MIQVNRIYEDRVLTNKELAIKNKEFADWFAEMRIDTSKNEVDLSNGKLLIIDPIYLSDIYNENGRKEMYLKENGVLLTDFGGDVSGPIFRTICGGIKIYLVFDRVNDEGYPVFRDDEIDGLKKNVINSEELGCDSGSYIFLDFSKELKEIFHDELKEQKPFVIDLPKGLYSVGYEQWDTNEENPYEAWRRNIVVWRTKKA